MLRARQSNCPGGRLRPEDHLVSRVYLSRPAGETCGCGEVRGGAGEESVSQINKISKSGDATGASLSCWYLVLIM